MDDPKEERSETIDGLSFKGRSLVEGIRIHTKDERRLTVKVFTWQCSRLLRRDLNYLISRMYFLCLNKKRKAYIQDLICELHEAADALVQKASSTPISEEIHSTLEFRLVSSESSLVLDAILKVDRALPSLQNLVGVPSAKRDFAQFLTSFCKLQGYVLHHPIKPNEGSEDYRRGSRKRRPLASTSCQ